LCSVLLDDLASMACSPIEALAMPPFRFRVRTLMFSVWMSAILIVGTLDVLNEYRTRSKVVVVSERVATDGSRSATLLYSRRTHYYLGPLPIGPCPVAVFSAVTFIASTVVWILRRRAGDRNR
jgi:hypothetical protein